MYSWLDDTNIAVEDLQAEMKINQFVKKRKWSVDYLQSDSILKVALDEYSEIKANYFYWTRSSLFFWLQSVLYQDEKLKALSNKSDEFSKNIMIELHFFELSLWKIDEDTQKKILQSNILHDYKQFLKRIFDTSIYDLSEDQEKIISIFSKTSYQNRVQMIDDFFAVDQAILFDQEGNEIKKTFEEVMSMISHTDKWVRDSAALWLNTLLNKYINVWEIEINSILEYKKMTDQLRWYTRADQSRLVSDDVSIDILDSLVDSVNLSNDISRDFYKLKAELLWLNKLEYHERNVPFLWKVEELTYTFDQAIEIVWNVLKKLDLEFGQIFEDFLQKWLIDVYPKEWKQGWAFNAGLWKNVGNVVMLNYTNKFRDVVTFAHEMWHAINSHLTGVKQKWVYYWYWMFTAEVASTFFEDFVFDELLKTANDEQKLSIMMDRLNDTISTVHRQIWCYRFEQELHSKFREHWYLSKETIWAMFQKNMADYMWEFVKQSEWSQNWWLYWSHIRRFFYVYSYAGGLLIAKELQNKVRTNPEYINAVKNVFLSAWRSISPKEMFDEMWINIADNKFWLHGLDRIRQDLRLAEDLAKKLQFIW